MKRPFNFSAGPAAMPQEVLTEAAAEMLDWHGSGMSVMEMSHRGKELISIYEQAQADLRELLAVPANFKILFMQGGDLAENAIVLYDAIDNSQLYRNKVATTCRSRMKVPFFLRDESLNDAFWRAPVPMVCCSSKVTNRSAACVRASTTRFRSRACRRWWTTCENLKKPRPEP
jgi:phosphoserine aminotransferase